MDSNDFIYEIRFGDYFNNDTIDLFINKEVALKKITLISDPSDGLTTVWVKILKKKTNYCFFTSQNNEVKSLVTHSDDMDLSIAFKGVVTKYTLKSEKGKFIVLSSDGKGNIIFTQTHHKPIFD